MRTVIGLIGRLVFWLGFLYIVGHAVLWSYVIHDYGAVVLKLVFFPLTYIIYPWYSGLWWVWLLSMVGYACSTLIGRMAPVGESFYVLWIFVTRKLHILWTTLRWPVLVLFVVVLLYTVFTGNTSPSDKELRRAAGRGDVTGVKIQLDKGVDVNAQDENGGTALMLAAYNGRVEVVQRLLKQKADPNITEKGGGTALMMASSKGYAEVVKLLLESGSDVNCRDQNHATALM